MAWSSGPSGSAGLANRHIRAAVAVADREGDPLSITWTQVVASWHWLGVGDWATLDARLAEALRAGAEAGCTDWSTRRSCSAGSAAT
jgi:hypothetical protein